MTSAPSPTSPGEQGSQGFGSSLSRGEENAARKARHDGWTPVRQAQFLALVEETGCVRAACSGVGLSSTSAYRFRKLSAAFAKAWDAALARASANIEAIAYERLVQGTRRVRMRAGEELWTEYRQSDALLALMLKARVPGFGARPSTALGMSAVGGGGEEGSNGASRNPGTGQFAASAAGGRFAWNLPRVDASGMVTVTVRMLPEEAAWYLSDDYTEMLGSDEHRAWAAMHPNERERATVAAIRERVDAMGRAAGGA